jgi:hypothetical protein
VHNIFVLSANVERVSYFNTYYNVLHKDTDSKLHLIIDDRHLGRLDTDTIESLTNFTSVHYVSDIISSVRQFIAEKSLPFYDAILERYKVSIKWLVFIYANKILGIHQAALLDDDTFLLQPIDHYFQNKHVVMREGMSGMSDRVQQLLTNVYGDIVDINKMKEERHYINSGQMIYTWDDDVLLEFMNRTFCRVMYDFVEEGIKKYAKKSGVSSIRKTGGFYWIIEQYVYAVFFEYLNQRSEVKRFNSDMILWTYNSFKFDSIKKLPLYIHFLPKDKTPLYTDYVKMLDSYLEKEHK